MSPSDFGHTPRLIEAAYDAARMFLDGDAGQVRTLRAGALPGVIANPGRVVNPSADLPAA